jgi:hypothetical protein
VVLNYFYKLIAMDNDNSMAYSISQSFQGGNMPAPPQFLYKQIYIHPQEADRIAEEIRNLIERLEKEHAGLDTSFLPKGPILGRGPATHQKIGGVYGYAANTGELLPYVDGGGLGKVRQS